MDLQKRLAKEKPKTKKTGGGKPVIDKPLIDLEHRLSIIKISDEYNNNSNL